MARTTLAAASIALLALCAFTAPVQARTTATIVIQTAPPPPRYEVMPPPDATWSGCPATGSGAATIMCG